MGGYVVYCIERGLFYQGSQNFGEKPKFYKQRNHASNAINNARSRDRDTLRICPASLVVEYPEEKEI